MKTKLILVLPLLALVAGCGDKGSNGSAPAAPAAAVAAPAGTQWSTTFAETADGGMLMGNPKAAVKLIEYGALSCPHCARFSKDSRDALRRMIDRGTISYELRTFLIHPQDVPATLLARCNGAQSFYAMAEQMFDSQDIWLAKSSTITQADQQAWTAMTPNAMAAAMADKLGLVDFVQQRGVGGAKAKACLADPKDMAKLERIVKVATDEYQIQGTPTFIVNGRVVPETTQWDKLLPVLKSAGA